MDELIRGFRCECQGQDCLLAVDVPREEAVRNEHLKHTLIVDGCTNGAPDGLRLVESRQGYAWYAPISEMT